MRGVFAKGIGLPIVGETVAVNVDDTVKLDSLRETARIRLIDKATGNRCEVAVTSED